MNINININCTCYRGGGICTHQAAPRRLFGPARCIVYEWLDAPHKDLRIAEPRCALQVEHKRPNLPK